MSPIIEQERIEETNTVSPADAPGEAAKRLKVLFIAFDSEELSIRLASELSKTNDVCLKLPREGSKPHLNWLSDRVQFEPFDKPRLRQSFTQMRTMLSLVRSIRKYNPDVIHFQKGHLWFNMVLPLLRKYPLVISVHDPVPHVGDKGSQKTPQSIRNFGFRRADKIIVHSPQMKDRTVKHCGIDAERIHSIPLMERGNPNLRTDVQEKEGTILFFGRIWEYKGLEYLIKAEPLVTAKFPHAKFVIAGTGDDFDAYRQMMTNPDRFEVHHRYISDDEIPVLFRESSVVVLPYIAATQSGVIPTSYTYGKPVVATTVGGLPSMVDDGETGLLVEPKNAQALADAMIEMLSDPVRRKQMGENGKAKAEAEFSAKATAVQTKAIYDLAIGSRR